MIGLVVVTQTMSTTISSYRSSNSRRLRQIAMRSQDNANDDEADASHNIESSSRGRLNDYSAPQETPSSKQSTSSSSSSDLPVMMFLRHLFERYFTKRRRGRKKGKATRKMKNNDYQTQDDEGKAEGVGTRNLCSLSSIPTNEHEMFNMLHSKARSKKPPRLPGESGSGQSTISHRNMQASRGRRTHVRSMTPPMIIITDRRTDEHQILFS